MDIAFLGFGHVGANLASHLQRLGHNVTLIAHSKESKSLKEALQKNPSLKVGNEASLSSAAMVFLTVPFNAVDNVLEPIKELLDGKIVIDCTNPVGPNLTHGLNNQQSGTEKIQAMLPKSHVVKAFTIYGYENFDEAVRSKQPQASMLFCGNNQEAKKTVTQLIQQLGWSPVDVGNATMALHLEHMTLLWIKMVRVHKQENFLWTHIKA
jgi:predicted dinucleotide-binding enzyme